MAVSGAVNICVSGRPMLAGAGFLPYHIARPSGLPPHTLQRRISGSLVDLPERGSIMLETDYTLAPIGFLHSPLKDREHAPMQGSEGAPDAWLEVNAAVADGLAGIEAGQELILITWLHQSQRDILQVHPRDDTTQPLRGVFATRSPDRPNPLGLHRVTVRAIAGTRLDVGPIEAIDGTPVVDMKPVLAQSADACRPA